MSARLGSLGTRQQAWGVSWRCYLITGRPATHSEVERREMSVEMGKKVIMIFSAR